MTGCIYDKIVREKGGKKLNITIEQATHDHVAQATQHMVDHFLVREPLCIHSDMINDPVSVESFRSLWSMIFEGGAAIVALLHEDEHTDPKIIGANATNITNKNDPPLQQLPGASFNVALAAIVQITEEAKLWERYGVASYLSAYGLSVDRNYHGIGLGEAIINAREKVCEKFNVPMTETVFTAAVSQHIAEKAGFETVLEYPYKDFQLKVSDKFKDLDGKISLMVKRFK